MTVNAARFTDRDFLDALRVVLGMDPLYKQLEQVNPFEIEWSASYRTRDGNRQIKCATGAAGVPARIKAHSEHVRAGNLFRWKGIAR